MARERDNMLRKGAKKDLGGRGGETMEGWTMEESRPKRPEERDPVKGGPPPPHYWPINRAQMDRNTGSQISVLI